MADLSIEFLGRSAVRAFLRHDEKMALEHLLEAWHHSRGERLAGLVERLSPRLERFEAWRRGQWGLEWTPEKDVPLRATLLSEEGAVSLAEGLRGALGFGARAVHVHVVQRADRDGLRLLREVASAYARVEWS